MSRKKEYTYHPMQMHLHSSFQPGGSMRGHLYNAKSLGIKYIWFTDHDNRIHKKQYPGDYFDFTLGKLAIEDGPNHSIGWINIKDEEWVNSEPLFEVSYKGLTVSNYDRFYYEECGGDGEGSKETLTAGIEYSSSARRHTSSLLADISLEIKFRVIGKLHGDNNILFNVRLSQSPPLHKPSHLVYALRKGYKTKVPNTKVIDLDIVPDDTGLYSLTLNLTKDLTGADLGGLDNVFDTLGIIVQSSDSGDFSCFLESFRIIRELDGYQVHERQKKLAKELEKEYGVYTFVGTEITRAGNHKNCLSTKTPLVDYPAYDYKVSQRIAIDLLKKHKALFSYNHPFLIYQKQGNLINNSERFIGTYAAILSASKVYGAQIMEVGFPEGRYNASLQSHLRLWDLLSLSGTFITGSGVNDSHSNSTKWLDENNFASWVGADKNILDPVPEEEFAKSLASGKLYMGDPVYLKGKVEFETLSGLQMGSIVLAKDYDDIVEVRLFMDKLEKGWSLRQIQDGELVRKISIKNRDFSKNFSLQSNKTVSFIRFELYNHDKRCIMLTNPIYLVRDFEYLGEIPENRLEL